MDLQPFFPDNSVCLREELPDSKTWRILNVDYGSLNYLRRWLRLETITVAFNWFKISFNNTRISNEVIAQRVGLIPIQFNPLNLEPFTEQSTQLCSEKTCLVFEADVYNQTNEIINLTTNDFIWIPLGNQSTTFAEHPRLTEDLLISRLYPGQRIALKIYGVRGTGSQHIRWSSVHAFYDQPTLLPSNQPYEESSLRPVTRSLQPIETRVEIISEYYDPRFETQNQATAKFYAKYGDPIEDLYRREDIENLPANELQVFAQIFQLPPASQPGVRKRILRILELLNALEPAPIKSRELVPEIDTGCGTCESLPKEVKRQRGFNCYYFTVELIGALTFEEVMTQLEQNFEWPEEFVPVDRVLNPKVVEYFRPTVE